MADAGETQSKSPIRKRKTVQTENEEELQKSVPFKMRKKEKERIISKEKEQEEIQPPETGPKASMSLVDQNPQLLKTTDMNSLASSTVEEREILKILEDFTPLQAVAQRAQGLEYTEPLHTTWTPPRYTMQISEQEKDQIREEFHIQIKGMDWIQHFEDLFHESIPKDLADLSLDALVKMKKKPQNLQNFCDSAVSTAFGYPILVPTHGEFIALFGIGGQGTAALAAAVGPVVAAAVGPAVAAAVGPAVVAAIGPIASVMRNIRFSNRNAKAFEAINLQPLSPLLKENAGAGLGLPNALAVAPLPPGHPFPIGVPIPVPFPINTAIANNLTLAELNTLSIMYNDTFEVVAGDTLAITRTKFNAWISGL